MKNLQIIIDRVNIRYQELGDNFNINQLRSIIRDQDTPLEGIEMPDEVKDEMPYTRKILFRNEVLEIVILRWKPYAESMIHDHGDSYGIVRVLAGTLNFQIYDKYLREIGVGCVPAVDTFDLPEAIIHKMINPSAYDEAISLHFYCPNIDGMSLYDIDTREKLTVQHGSNAWQPGCEQIVLREKLDDIPVEIKDDNEN